MSEASGDSIFDDLLDTQEERPDVLSDVFAPEFLARFDGNELAVIMDGVSKAIARRNHPDVILNASDQSVADVLRKTEPGDLTSAEPEVRALHERMLEGAQIIDEFRERADTVGQDPTAARLTALQAIKKKGGIIPRSDRTDSGSSKNQSRRNKAGDVDLRFETAARARLIQEMIAGPQALHRVDTGTILGKDADGNPALYQFTSGRINGEDDAWRGLTMRPLSRAMPTKYTYEASKRALREMSEKRALPFYPADLLHPPAEENSIYLTTDIHQSGHELESHPAAQSSQLIEALIALNKSHSGEDLTTERIAFNFFSMAIKSTDPDSGNTVYTFLPNSQGQMLNMKPTADPENVLQEWLSPRFKQLPDVVQFSFVNRGVGTDTTDVYPIVSGYMLHGDEQVLFDAKRDAAQLGSVRPREVYLGLVGLMPTVAELEITADTERTALEKTGEHKNPMRALRPEVDVELQAGAHDAFLPHMFDRARIERLGNFLIVRAYTPDNIGGSDDYLQADQQKVFAIPGVTTIGIKRLIPSDKKRRIEHAQSSIDEARGELDRRLKEIADALGD